MQPVLQEHCIAGLCPKRARLQLMSQHGLVFGPKAEHMPKDLSMTDPC